MKKTLALILALAMSIGLCACGGETGGGGEASTGPASLSMATGGTSGTYYGFSGVVANVLNEKLGDVLNITVQSTGASGANIDLIDTGANQLAIVQNDVMYYAATATDMYEGKAPLESYSAVMSCYPEYVQIIANKDITSIDQLKGKKVSVGDSGSGVEFNAQQILGAYDIIFEDIDKQNLSFQASADALKDGKIDAFFCTAGAPTVAITDLSTTTGIVLVEIDAEHLAALQSNYGFYAAYTVPAGTYNGIDVDVTTVAVKATFIVSNDLDEETVYQLTKAIYENKDEYSHEKASEMSNEYAVSSISVPFHPGAERYFKEVGAIS